VRTILWAAAGRPRVRRAYALLFEAITLRTVDQQRSRRTAAAAARAFNASGDALHESSAIELAGRELEAAERYRNMGNVRDAERLRLERPKPVPLELTARQAQIADLVALGETNRSIAQQLHISEHTVEHHLSGIFARLNLRSRAQLARVLARGGDRAAI